ncbi:retrovirus-related pol polyprotein from transposon TNT 1-94 [Tanacetum coccineum]
MLVLFSNAVDGDLMIRYAVVTLDHYVAEFLQLSNVLLSHILFFPLEPININTIHSLLASRATGCCDEEDIVWWLWRVKMWCLLIQHGWEATLDPFPKSMMDANKTTTLKTNIYKKAHSALLFWKLSEHIDVFNKLIGDLANIDVDIDDEDQALILLTLNSRKLKKRTDAKDDGYGLFVKGSGIARHLTVAGTLQQNGLAERMYRTLLIHSGLLDSLWAEAMVTAAYLINRSPSTILEKNTRIVLFFHL